MCRVRRESKLGGFAQTVFVCSWGCVLLCNICAQKHVLKDTLKYICTYTVYVFVSVCYYYSLCLAEPNSCHNSLVLGQSCSSERKIEIFSFSANLLQKNDILHMQRTLV